MMVVVEGYCGLCYDVLRIAYRFQVFDIFNHFFHLMGTV